MTELILFHHAQGLTPGVHAFAEELRASGNEVHVPDLFDGKTFSELGEGLAYAEAVGFDTILDRGRRAAETLSDQIVYAGLSLGVLPAQMLAQTRPGAKGAVLVSAAVPPSEFGNSWPTSVPLQVHMKEQDQLVVEEGDLEAARELVSASGEGELFLYPGSEHLFVDSSLPDHDEAAAALLKQRVLSFLAAVS
jgi:dienelactone hydrolase